MIPIDELVFFDVITSTPSTSAAVDADSAPTFDVFEEDTDTAILAAQTMTKRTSKTGNYRGTFTASAANGFEAGKWYSVVASGIVGGVTGKVTAMRFRVAPAESSAGVPKMDLSHILGTALTETAGLIAAGFKKFFNVATPTGTVNSLPDAVAGAASGVALVGSAVGAATSVSGSVGSVAGNVGGNVTGSVGSLATQAKADVNAEVDTALADAGVTSTRTAYLDKLNISGNVAGSTEVTSIQNNTRVVRVVPDVIERPDSGTITYRIELLLYDTVGNMEAPDSAPTIALVNQAGTDRSSRLDSTTMALVSTGRYRAIYTADVADTLEQLVWAFSVVEGGNTRLYGNQSLIVDTTAVDFTAADRTKLELLATDFTTARAVKIDNLDATVSSRATPAQVKTQADAAIADAALATAANLAIAKTAIDSRASQVSVDDLPTNSEMATALGAADDAILAAISALNNITADAARDAVFLQIIEGTTTFLQAQRAQLGAANNNVVVNTGTGQVLLKSQDGTKNRATATTDEDGNRTVTARDLT